MLTQAPVSADLSFSSPFWMSEGDVVLLCPACKHLFLCDEAMVVSSSAALILYVCYTFIRPPGFVVVVWHLLGSRFSAVIGLNHSIYFDVVTYLNGYDHCEPACAQPRVRFLPISSCFSVKQIVKSAHLARRDTETRQVAVGHAESLDQPVQGSFRLLPNLVWGSPEDDHRVAVCAGDELIGPSDHPEHTGVSYDPQSRPVSNIRVVSHCGGVIHANDTLSMVNLLSCSTTQDVAGTRHQCTVMTVQVHSLVPIKWYVTISPGPFFQVCSLDGVICSHMERSIDGLVGIVGAVQDKECHQDEDGGEDHHPVALSLSHAF